jgi:ribosomal-protein-alanine N-acetyltransferase
MHSFNTERLLIRPLAEQDKALYLSLYCDTEVMRNIGEPLSFKSAEKSFCNTLKAMKRSSCKVLTWTIIDKLNNQTIGIQVLNFNDEANNKSAEVGIMLSTKRQNTGLGKEAMSVLLQYGFTQLSLDIVTALYAKKNLASHKLFHSLDFILSATPIIGYTKEKYSIQKCLLHKKTIALP